MGADIAASVTEDGHCNGKHHSGKHKKHHSKGLSFDSVGDLAMALPLSPWPAIKTGFSRAALMLQLAIKLWTYLGIGYRWTLKFWRLVIYAMLLLPGFIQVIAFYFLSPRVIRNVAYGRGPRQQLDIYLPKSGKKGQPHPVAIFITGGAWTIGYKAWGALLADRLSAAGVLVLSLDYRNFPQGDALDMLEDVNTGIAWVMRRCTRYGGDPDNIVLIGQSAGGQLGALAMLRQAEREATGIPHRGATPAWNPRDIRAFISVSGAYDLETLADHLHKRGLYKNLFSRIMSVSGVPAWQQMSPALVAAGWGPSTEAAAYVPPVLLIHGKQDKSVPASQASEMHQTLLSIGVDSTLRLVDGGTHTHFILEGPMRGGRDPLMEHVLPLIRVHSVPSSGGSSESGDSASSVSVSSMSTASTTLCMEEHAARVAQLEAARRDVEPQVYRQLCPTVLCMLASWVCPF